MPADAAPLKWALVSAQQARHLAGQPGDCFATNPIARSPSSMLLLPAQSGRGVAVTAAGVEEPCSGRLATADADLPSLSYGHLVGDSTGPAPRGGCRTKGSVRAG
jgi:hypothetical protein